MCRQASHKKMAMLATMALNGGGFKCGKTMSAVIKHEMCVYTEYLRDRCRMLSELMYIVKSNHFTGITYTQTNWINQKTTYITSF